MAEGSFILEEKVTADEIKKVTDTYKKMNREGRLLMFSNCQVLLASQLAQEGLKEESRPVMAGIEKIKI